MKISRIEPMLLSCPFPEPLRLPFYGGERTILKRDAMIIRVTTDSGLIGFAPGPAHEAAAIQVRDVIGPFLHGRDPRDWQAAAAAFTGDAGLKKTYHAVEIAVLDVLARFEGCALSEVMGGRVRSRIKLYGSAGMYMSPEGYAAEAAAIQAMGFPAYKMRPALGPDRDLETVAKMRAATGEGFGLMIDAHSWWRMGDRSYTPETVARLASAFEAYGPMWLEEPLPPDDHDAYRHLRTQTSLPIATGEHEQHLEGFLDLLETGAADYRADGRLLPGRPVVVASRSPPPPRRRAVASRSTAGARPSKSSLPRTSASAGPRTSSSGSSIPATPTTGSPACIRSRPADEILKEPLAIEDGYLTVPDGPGLGIEVDDRLVDRYPFIPGPWSLFRLDSPPSTIAVVGDHSVKWVGQA